MRKLFIGWRKPAWAVLGLTLLGVTTAVANLVEEYQSGIVWPEPPVIDPGSPTQPPSDALVLFGGQDLSQWIGGENWEIRDGYAIARQNGLSSKQEFGDCQLHLEFATPEQIEGEGQGRGNSGVYLMGRYEVQILDSHENKTYYDGQCGAIYKQQPPTVNASRKPGEWQSYDIIFTAPRFAEDGSLAKPASVTVLHNGVVIHNHYELQGTTSYTEAPRYEPHGEKGPIHIQFHGNPVRFRNIWIRENIQPLQGYKPSEQAAEASAEPTTEQPAEAATDQP